jgi:hydrogenase-4 component B
MNLVLAAAGVLVASALAAAFAGRRPRVAAAIAALGTVVAAALALPGAIGALVGEPASEIDVAWAAPIDHLRFGLDPLSAFFVIPVALLGAVCAIYGAFYLDDQRTKRAVAAPAAFYNLLVAAMLLVLTSRDAIGFIIAWEVMTLASYLLIIFDHAQPEVRRAGWIYVIASHVGVACLLCMFLLLGERGYGFAEIAGGDADATTATTAAVLGLVGFGIKAGMVPLHVWLPEAHAAAPSHVSALMSGALIKLGIYGILRTITFVPDALPWGPVLVGVGVVGAFVGISLALYQRDLKRALAYSSVENIGIIAIGLGVGLWAANAGYTKIAALGLCGGLFHVWNHVVMKALMFLGAGSLLHGTGTRDVEQMGGLAKRMPRTATLMIVGSLAISALPPFNGFASEWLIYLGLAQGGIAPESGSGLLLLFAVAAMGTVGVLAVLCFVRVIGVTLLGQPRSEAAAAAHESGRGLIAPMVVLAGLAIVMPFLLPVLAGALDPVIQQITGAAFASDVLPSDHAADALSPLAIVGVVLWTGGVVAILAIRRLTRRRRETETWGCGYVAPSARMQYSGASFAEGIHRLLPGILRARLASQQTTELFPARGKLSADRQDPFTRAAYAPLMDQGASRFGKLRWVQQGLLHLYILYVVIAVVVAITVVSIRDYWVLP